MSKGEKRRGAFSAVSPLQERLYDNKNTFLFSGFSSRLPLTSADNNSIMITRKENIMINSEEFKATMICVVAFIVGLLVAFGT